MQKTLTIAGITFNARQIERMFDTSQMTNGDDYIIILNRIRFFANYRQQQDQYFAPVCDRDDANCIALMPDDGLFKWQYWLEFRPVNQAAAALGSVTSEAKAKAARENGKKGGRPRR